MSSSFEGEPFTILRQRMVDSQLRARGIGDQRVLDAMLRVPRHEFAPERYRDQAYEDHPLPIGEGQTISQPYIVARMLEALALKPTDRALEVGTGSGYVTALLAELTEQAPYHAIIVSAAASEVPRALPEQLREGGRMIIPVGAADSQQLQLIRMESGQPRISLHELCRFVPLVAEHRY